MSVKGEKRSDYPLFRMLLQFLKSFFEIILMFSNIKGCGSFGTTAK